MRTVHFLLSLATVSLAAPANYFDGVYEFSNELADFYSKVSMYINRVQQSTSPSAICDTSKITLPSYASEWQPSQDGTTPVYVALGRGTQVCLACDHLTSDFDALIDSLELHLCRLHVSFKARFGRRCRQSLQCNLPGCRFPGSSAPPTRHCLQNLSASQQPCSLSASKLRADGASLLRRHSAHL